ncbi:hypothetical protein [Paraliomyxa miuraensis]|uniref:hypothetical protein n=1 Tax=Paraliomyxa miuraensis TaxID=376150 RepID=UPI002253FD80|nr:hypothetical protein [Paraliomyxa miuraensis]MCX4247564.1 hypothetical protein [Paraliomyxa miuraensis]
MPSCSLDPNLRHCSLLEGDETCAALYPSGVLPFCSAGCQTSPHGNGCVADRPEDACYSPCGQGLTAVELAQCPQGSSSAGSSGGSTGETGATSSSTAQADDTASDTGIPGCRVDADCEPTMPSCVDGQCVPCTLAPDPDLVCAQLDPMRPLCADDRCVACTEDDASACEDPTPVCDLVEGTCVACTRHEQCPQSACHLEMGSCLPTDRVWWVDGDAGGCAGADGSEASPYCTVAGALANVGVGETGTLWVRARAGDAAYAAGLTLTGGRVVAVRGLADERPRFSGGGVGAPITISGGAVAYLDRGRVDGSSVSEAIAVVGAVLHLDGWLVVLNPGGGVSLSNGAELHARTSVLGANGSGLIDAQALRAAASTFELRYVTVAGNDSAGVASIECMGGSAGVVHDSIVVGIDSGSIACPGLVVDHSAIDSLLAGDGVVLRESFDSGWFLAPGAGDFHLVSPHPFDDVAQWQPGDPIVDLDGEPRPQMAGAPDVAGADR